MNPEEAVRLRWLDSITADALSLKSLVLLLETSYEVKKLVAYDSIVQSVIKRFRNVYDVLELLQRQTQEDQDDARELTELVRDLVGEVSHLRAFLVRLSEEDTLCQLIRIQKLVGCLEQARRGLNDLVDGIQQTRFGDRFNELAATANINVNMEKWSESYRFDQFNNARIAVLREFEARDPATSPFSNADKFYEERDRALWTLEFEKKRLWRMCVSDPLFDLVESDIRALKNEANLMPWFIPSDEITRGEEVGSGGYAAVFKGRMGKSTDVAVKRMLHVDKETLLRSINLWYQLNHPHILRFYGASYPDSDCSIVCEFAKCGELARFVATPSNKKQVWRLLYEAALGVHYMHQQGYVHGDLNCSNILVGDDLKAKIGGFTLSFRNGDHKKVQRSEASQWVAPECFDGVKERSFPSDVYSFGMSIVEALILGPPWGSSVDAAVRRFVKRGTLPISISHLAPEVQVLIKAMCAFDPSQRMKMEEVIEKLKYFADANDPELRVVNGSST